MTLYILFCVILAVVLGAAWYSYYVPFYSPPRGEEKPPVVPGASYDPYREQMRLIYRQLVERPFEPVTITSHDGLTLYGRYYHVRDGAPLDIGFHGYRSGPMRDFSGGSQLSFLMGHNLLLVDHRAHGKSQGRTITFGLKERLDLVEWVHWALERFGHDLKIVLYGVSMGGATVLMASELELPDNVKAIIADCPYSSPLDIILEVGRRTGYPPKLIRPFVILGAKIFGGFDVRERTAAQAVKHTRVPILIIHGDADAFVPETMSLEVQQANPAMVQRITVHGADHGISYLVDTPKYHTAVQDFLKDLL